MNKTQKGACYGLFLAGMLLLVPVVDMLDNVLNPIVLRVCGYGAAFLMVLPLMFLQKKSRKAGVDFDERDRLICRKALVIALVVVLGLLSTAYMITLFALGEKASIPVGLLPEIVYSAFIVFILTLSVAVLLQYQRRGKGEES